MTRRWFRWYEGTTEDGKFRMVARNAGVTVATVMGVWATLLEDASHLEHRGFAKRGRDFYAAILDLKIEELDLILGQMDIASLIINENFNIEITRWKERQFETDTTDGTNAERQQRWRNKHKTNATQTDRNGSVTEAKRPDTDTDTDTDTEKNIYTPTKRNSGKKKLGPLPEGWAPNETHHRISNSLNLNINEIEHGFRDYLAANAKLYSDYDAAFRTFLRNAPKFNGAGNGSRGSRPLQDDSRSASRAAAELAEKAKRGEFTFGPRPGLAAEPSRNVVQLLPKGRDP